MRPTAAGEVGHGRVAEEATRSDEGKRPTGHTDPVLGEHWQQRERPERICPVRKGQRIIKLAAGIKMAGHCPSLGAVLGCAAMTMIVFGHANRGFHEP